MSSVTTCSTFVTHSDLRFHRRSWESDGAGGNILLVHGLSSNAQVWDLVASILAEAGFHTTAFDMRGHGSSAKPNDGYDFNTLAADLRGLVEACQLAEPILVGHSFGAMLALDYAARYRKGKWAPAGIVLVDGGMAQLDAYPGATLEGVLEVLSPPKFDGTTLAEFLAHFKDGDRKWSPDDQALELILSNFEIRRDGTLSPHMTYPRHIEALKALWEFKTYERYERLRCPVLMLPVLPPEPHTFEEGIHLEFKDQALERARAEISDLHVNWLKDAVHDVLLQKPNELAEQIIAFASA
jgi:pimeloyl-ACP methyl ester carboxylesterase